MAAEPTARDRPRARAGRASVASAAVGAIDVNGVACRTPGGVDLLADVSFRVGDGEHVRSSAPTAPARRRCSASSPATSRRRPGASTSTVGCGSCASSWAGARRAAPSATCCSTCRPTALQRAAARPRRRRAGGRRRARRPHRDGAGARPHRVGRRRRLGRRGAVGHLLHHRRPPAADRRRGDRPLATLSGGEQKRLALEVLLRSDADVLLLDEPDNYLDVPGKEWLEDALRACPKTILLISHDRQLLAGVAPSGSSPSRAARRGCTAGRSPRGTTPARRGSPASTTSTAAGRRSASGCRPRSSSTGGGRRWAATRSPRGCAPPRPRSSASRRPRRREQVRRPPGHDAPRRRPHRHPGGHLRAARAARPHRPVRHRGRLRRARRRARPQRHRQEPLPAAARR